MKGVEAPLEDWPMYSEIQQLRTQGLRKSQVSRALSLNIKTVGKYWLLSPAEVGEVFKRGKHRAKRTDAYEATILSWIREFSDLSSSQIRDRLQQIQPEGGFRERTIRRYVASLRTKHALPRQEDFRQYEAVDELPPGQQLQLDFGETWVRPSRGATPVKLYCMGAVLAHSRYKYAFWRDRPFTTLAFLDAINSCFVFFGGMPAELVIDQDKLAVVSENHGDILFTQEFEAFKQDSKLQVRLCRRHDPESKGKIEAVIKYLKYHFAKNRYYKGLTDWNEETLAWLARTGNASVHGTTKKVPAEVFLIEQQHLRPVPFPRQAPESIVTLAVRKDNTVLYRGNRYSVPLGTYRPGRKLVFKEQVNALLFCDEGGNLVAEHRLCKDKGKLIKNNHHRRDTGQSMREYQATTLTMLSDTPEAQRLLEEIQKQKPRYARDQYALLRKMTGQYTGEQIGAAILYCQQRQIYSAVSVRDAADMLKALLPNPVPLLPVKLPDRLLVPAVHRDIAAYSDLLGSAAQ